MLHTAVPIVDDPQEEVTQKLGEVVVELQASRRFRQPRYHTLKPVDGISVDHAVHLVGHEVGVLDDVGAQCYTDDDVVRDKPEAVKEANVFRMAVRDALPVGASAVQSQILCWPVAELLKSNINLLRRGRDVL